MRYFAETVGTKDAIWIKNIFPLRHVQIFQKDLLSFEYDESKDSFPLSDLVINSNISRVFIRNNRASKFQSSFVNKLSKLRLMWYGRCDNISNDFGAELELSNYRSKLDSVWKPSKDNKSFISWSSKIHPSVKQPFSKIKEGNLYLVKSLNSVPFSTAGINDSTEFGKMGISQCDHNSNFVLSLLEYEYNLVWYGICDSDLPDYFDLQSSSNIKEVYQYSKEGNDFNGVYYADDLSKSTITKLEFGNGYLIILKPDKTEMIPNCAVSTHDDVTTSIPTHPLRLADCFEQKPTPTPSLVKKTPTPLNSSCCEGKIYTTIKNGVADHINNISVVGSPDGILCWDEINDENDQSPQQHTISLGGADFKDGGLSISTLCDINGKIFTFQAKSGICYRGKIGEDDVFNVVGDATSHPTPTPTLTPTPTIMQPANCCSENDVSILVTKEMAESTNPSGPAGVTISGFQEGGVICMSNLTDKSDAVSCMLVTTDGTIAGLITLSFEPNSYEIKYKCTSGKCYTGVIQNTLTEPQILTEV